MPFAFAAGFHAAALLKSIVLLVVAFHATPLIVNVPLLTALTTKELIEPSTSDSLPAASSSVKLIATEVSSVVAFTELPKLVNVGEAFITVPTVNKTVLEEIFEIKNFLPPIGEKSAKELVE